MKSAVSVLLALCITTSAFTQINPNSLTLDLGQLNGNEKDPTTAPVRTMRLETIYLKNAFPRRSYIISVEVTPHLLPPLSMAGLTSSGSACTALEESFTAAYKFASEEDASKKEKDLRDTLKKLTDAVTRAGCTDNSLLNKIKVLQANCVREFTLPIPVDMTESNDYTVTVTTGERSFKYKFEGKSPGRWVMNYGFLFSSKRLEPVRYFLQQTGADSFQIKRRKKYGLPDLRFTPSIFFSYFLDRNLNKPWNNSLSIGLGFNTQSPVVSLGYNGMYNQNIGISVGLVFYEQDKLDGRYHEGQILKENLDESKLYEKSIFRPNLFLALNIRLGENPFKTDKKN